MCATHMTGASDLMINAAGHKDMAGRRKEPSDYWGGATFRRALVLSSRI